MVVGWYHSHPGFGCWLSGVDINTQQVCKQLGNELITELSDTMSQPKLLSLNFGVSTYICAF